MHSVRHRLLLFVAATTVATTVFLAEVTSTYMATAYFFGIAAGFVFACWNAVTGGRAITSVALTGVVGGGYLAAMQWYNLHSYRLPPIPVAHFWGVPIAAIGIGLLGYAGGYLVRERTSLVPRAGFGAEESR